MNKNIVSKMIWKQWKSAEKRFLFENLQSNLHLIICTQVDITLQN